MTTEVLSESVELWGGVTTVVSGNITEYVSANSMSTLGKATISTITPTPTGLETTRLTTSVEGTGNTVVVSEVEVIYGTHGISISILTESDVSTITTLQTSTAITITELQTTVISGHDVFISEVLVIYNATRTYTTVSGTASATEILGGEISTPIDLSYTLSGFGSTTTDKSGQIISVSDVVVGGTTIIVTETVISTINVNRLTPSLASPTSDTLTFSISQSALMSILASPSMTAGFTTCSVWEPVPSPTVVKSDETLDCTFDTSEDKIDYDTIDWADPIDGAYWLCAEDLAQREAYIDAFCGSITGADTPDWRVQGLNGCGPGGNISETALYTNSVCRSYSGQTDMVIDTFNATVASWSGNSTPDRQVTLSITYDSNTWSDDPSVNCSYQLNGLSPIDCYSAFVDKILIPG